MTRRSIMPSRSPVQGCCSSFIDSSSLGDAAAALTASPVSSSAIDMHRHERVQCMLPNGLGMAPVLRLRRLRRSLGEFPQSAMHELHAAGTFTDGGGDALDAATAHVTGRKNSRQTGLEQIGLTR